MYHIVYTKDFQKSLKKLDKAGVLSKQVRAKLEKAITILAAGNRLPDGYTNHKLKGFMSDKWECHIKGDLVLVYKVIKDELVVVMVDIGTHSKIFG